MNLFKLLCFLCLTLPSVAQSPNPTTKIPAPDAVTRITLGQSVVTLNGPWRFSIGDSPIDPATHQPLWAEPGFDDAHLETVDLTPKKGLVDPMYGQPGYVPGWAARGHRGYTGYAWYRLRVQVDTQVGQKPGAKPARLALWMWTTGFDKVQQLLQNKTPIAALAKLAQQFGQQDDISLVAVTRA